MSKNPYNGRKMKLFTCVACGDEFTASQKTAKYCTDSCRKRYQYALKKQKEKAS